LLTKETQKIILTYKRPLSCFFEINFPLILFFFANSLILFMRIIGT
jgi:hypothetical protein